VQKDGQPSTGAFICGLIRAKDRGSEHATGGFETGNGRSGRLRTRISGVGAN
jgi:hypothetical protein